MELPKYFNMKEYIYHLEQLFLVRVEHIFFKLLNNFIDLLLFRTICSSLNFQHILQSCWLPSYRRENIWQEQGLQLTTFFVSEPFLDQVPGLLEWLAGDGIIDLDGPVEADDPELPPGFIFKLQNLPHGEVQVVNSHPLQLKNPLC